MSHDVRSGRLADPSMQTSVPTLVWAAILSPRAGLAGCPCAPAPTSVRGPLRRAAGSWILACSSYAGLEQAYA